MFYEFCLSKFYTERKKFLIYFFCFFFFITDQRRFRGGACFWRYKIINAGKCSKCNVLCIAFDIPHIKFVTIDERNTNEAILKSHGSFPCLLAPQLKCEFKQYPINKTTSHYKTFTTTVSPTFTEYEYFISFYHNNKSNLCLCWTNGMGIGHIIPQTALPIDERMNEILNCRIEGKVVRQTLAQLDIGTFMSF